MSEEQSKFSIPMTYSGLLDDVVYRHRITPEVDEEFFNRSILRNVFFSGRLYLNDGYLVNHPSALKQVLDDKSVLRMMIKQNFIKILVRQSDADSFTKNPEKMAKRGILSFQKLVDQVDWPEQRKKLFQFADGLYQYDMVEAWPNYQMHIGFQNLFARIFNKSIDELGLSEITGFDIDLFQRRYEEHPAFNYGPRTAVEEVAMSMAAEGLFEKHHVPKIINIANQCYHYNFAMCLSKSSNKAVVADTTIGATFEDILHLDQPPEVELTDIPVLSIPKGFPTNDGSLFDEMLDPSSNINNAKHDFLSNIDQLFKYKGNRPTRDIVSDVHEASQKYQSYLVEQFSGRVGIRDWAPKTSSIITFGLGKLGGAVGADNIMLAANLVTNNKASLFVHKITKPLRDQALKVAFNPDAGAPDDLIFRLGDIKPRFASLAFDQKASHEHVSKIPPINN